jgi:hypothetical protein
VSTNEHKAATDQHNRRAALIFSGVILFAVLVVAAWPGVHAVALRASAPQPSTRATPAQCVVDLITRNTRPGESVRFATAISSPALSRSRDNLVVAEPIESLIFPRLNLVTSPSAPLLTVMTVSSSTAPPALPGDGSCYGYRVTLNGSSL